MKKSRFSEQQIAFVLRQAEEGTPIAEVCRKAGISEASFYSWRKKYGGLVPPVGDEAAEAARGGEPAAEEAGGRSVARQGDAAGRHPPKNMRPARKRQLVDEVRSVWQVSIRRACQALPVDRSTYHYRCKRTGQAILMKRIKEIAETRVRYGYRRIHVLLRREGWLVNSKRVCRLYREMGLQLRNKSPKRRVKAQLREDRSPATAANQVWAMDFVRVLTIVDTFTRLSPAIEVRQNFRGIDVVDTLERVRQEIGCPKTIRLDNGPEFISKELDLWAFMRGVTLDFSRPGKPTDNAFIESLNGKFRAECLNANWFLSLDEARRKCEAWRRDYNEVRPHSAIGNQVPAVLHRMTGDPGQPVTR
jgi:putative transposase